MPQLNPTPWFIMLVSCWIVLLILIVPKVLAHTYCNSPAHQSAHVPNTTSWAWLWP
uniref:ATP synthase complex subunit 8 n=1 Tax=Proterorhinus semilunaris TaxID=322563 RepID=A0A8E8P9X7_9GOBI|nr:ATP synthase F0 subunit 8 [Proterorhinus semilunaris]QWE36517.1 ATP synthase F0 subunit 8 [Proterorhinus semilunaris]QWE37270.1 ATP synthase F0 subunit 8 [Proterorhinus semilunaris]QWE37322.1 ATP synthase F0 subunit 8 [Proterorhinus semilunaris]